MIIDQREAAIREFINKKVRDDTHEYLITEYKGSGSFSDAFKASQKPLSLNSSDDASIK